MLEAFEISILQNTIVIQITLLAWLFLGENLTLMKIVAMILVFSGVLIAQIKKIQTLVKKTQGANKVTVKQFL